MSRTYKFSIFIPTIIFSLLTIQATYAMKTGGMETSGLIEIEENEDAEFIKLTDNSNTDSVSIYTGTGSPDTALTAEAGSIFLDQSGTIYVNTNGGTAWTNLGSGSIDTIYSADGQITGGDRTIDLNGNYLNFQNTNLLLEIGEDEWIQSMSGTATTSELNMDSANITYSIIDSADHSSSKLILKHDYVETSTSPNGSNHTKQIINSTNIALSSDVANFQGAVYGADYSADYTTRSLVDKAYVDSKVGTSFWDSDSDTGIQVEKNPDEDFIRFDTNGTERMRIEGDGKIGINTNNPLTSILTIGTGAHENSILSVSGDSSYMNIANFRDEDGESIFRSSGSVAGGDLLISFGDVEIAGNATYIKIDEGNNHYDIGRGEFRFLDNGGGEYVGFMSPSIVSANTIWTLPSSDGTNGQILSTNGSGELSWSTDSTRLADNGLSLNTNTIELGGTLTKHTYIDHQGFSFIVREFSGETETEFNGDNFKIRDTSNNREIKFGIGGVDYAGLSFEGTNQHNLYYRDNTVLIDSNAAAFSGLQYGSNYSSDYTNRSLVDKEYVDSKVGTSFWDSDSDTGIQVEETADDDTIRFDTLGSEVMRIESDGDFHWMDGGYADAYFNIDNPSDLPGSDPSMAGIAFDSANDRTWLMGGEVHVAQNMTIGTTGGYAMLDIGGTEFASPSGDISVIIGQDGRDSFLETYSGDMSEGLIMHGLMSGAEDSGIVRQLYGSDYTAGWTKGLHIFNKNTDPILFSVNSNELVTINNSGGYSLEVKDSSGNRIIAPGISYNSNISGAESQNIGIGDVDEANNGTWLGIDTGNGAFGFNNGDLYLENNGPSTSTINFQELSANGSQFVAFTAPNSIVSNIVWTLPNADGANGQVMATNGSGVLNWVNSGGASPWGTDGSKIYPAIGGTDVELGSAETLLLGSIDVGQVNFSGTGRIVSGDNDLFWDNTNKRLGVRTNTPASELDIYGKISIDGEQTIYNAHAENADFLESLVIGNGGTNFSHTVGDEARYNNYIGINSGLSSTTGYGNAASGANSLQDNTTGHQNAAYGGAALYSNTIGNQNTGVGTFVLRNNDSGSGNTALGYNTGAGIVSGSNNTILGANVTGLAADLQSNIIIADGQGNQRIRILANGNVGIGTDTPNTALEVDGIIMTTPRTTATCDSTTEGGIYYDSDDNHFYGCNGSTWTQLD